MKKNKINKVWIERLYDDNPDTSFLGEYTDKKSDWAICRHCGEFVYIAEKANRRAEEIEREIYDLEYEDGNEKQIEALKKELSALELHDCQHSNREYNYFRPYAAGEKEGTKDYQKYGRQDYNRMEGLERGDWCFLGIIAKAMIQTPSGTLQTITSGSLWGIESDSGDYLDEIGKEQLEGLRAELIAFGFTEKDISQAFEDVETKVA